MEEKVRVEIDLMKCRDRKTTFDYLAGKIKIPDYFGNNLDALYDVLSVSDDLVLVIKNAAKAGIYGMKLLQVIRDAVEENHHLKLIEG